MEACISSGNVHGWWQIQQQCTSNDSVGHGLMFSTDSDLYNGRWTVQGMLRHSMTDSKGAVRQLVCGMQVKGVTTIQDNWGEIARIEEHMCQNLGIVSYCSFHYVLQYVGCKYYCVACNALQSMQVLWVSRTIMHSTRVQTNLCISF